MTESVVFYQSFHNAAKEMDDLTYGRYMRAVNDYAFNDIEPEFNENDFIIRMAFEFVRPQIDANKNRKSNGHKGGRPARKVEIQEKEISEKNQEEEIPAEENQEEKKTTKKRFSKPSVDEVKAYCEERKNRIDPERFVNYYDSKGWKIGSASMKDWKAAVRTWEQNQRDGPIASGGGSLPAERLTF